MSMRRSLAFALATLVMLVAVARGQETIVRVDLVYRGKGVAGAPQPNFSPSGTQVPLAAVPVAAMLPPGAVRPAKTGMIKIGPGESSWIPVLAAATAKYPKDLCQVFLDRNRNGNFADDGPGLAAEPAQNVKTRAWWSSINNVELSVPYGTASGAEPYQVNVWMVREDEADAPEVLRFSVGSWRSGTVVIQGVPALVAVMDADNNAIFNKADRWSVLEASAPNADRAVLSITEALSTSRMMFVKHDGRELVLEFRGITPDGRSLDMAVVDRPVTKAEDRRGDDTLAVERARPRTKAPFTWSHDLDAALAQAKTAGRKVFIDFETDWCGPCKSMDQWIWTDAEVAALLNAGYVGVKLDGDIEKALVKRFKVAGYPTMIVLDGSGAESWRAVGYQSSKEMLALLNAKR
jgi:thiol-disulfide isomerase/thioredoxin